MNEQKRIGVLTSGGDAPGMNAAVRAVTLAAIKKGYEVMGILNGYRGLVYNEMKRLSENDVENIIDRSGSVLYSDRCKKFETEEGLEMAYKNCVENNIVALVVIGGDGTLSGATEFSAKYHIPCIGMPGTIDNDLVTSDFTIGFDTAMNTVLVMADNLRHTCDSHRRCNIIRVMGRGAGDIALYSGIAAGAQAIMLKEVFFEKEAAFDDITSRLDEYRRDGKHNFLVVMAEGIPLDLKYGNEIGAELRAAIQERTGVKDRAEVENNPALLDQFEAWNEGDKNKVDFIETKYVSLEHTVRGGIPTLRDRQIASQMGAYAVELIEQGKRDRVVCINDGKIVDYDIIWALAADKQYKMLINKPYADADLLGADGKKSYEKAIRRYDEFTKFIPAEEVEKILPYCEKKLADFREACKTAETLYR